MLLNDKWYLFQSKTRIENLCDCSHRYNCCFGYCGRGSNSASAFWNSVQTRYFQTRVLFSWSLSWTRDCHLSRLHQRGSLCSGGWISFATWGQKGEHTLLKTEILNDYGQRLPYGWKSMWLYITTTNLESTINCAILSCICSTI